MKKISILFCLLYVFSTAYSQSGPEGKQFDSIVTQINRKASLFCDYLMAVGSSPNQPEAVSDKEKINIIKNRVPNLFWNYPERCMIIVNVANGQIKRQKMERYLRNLRTQSNSGLETDRKYELRFVGIVSNGDTLGFTKERILDDGSELWSATVRIKSFYHTIVFSANSPKCRSTEETEDDYKDYKVYLVIKPNGKTGVFLGDVTMINR